MTEFIEFAPIIVVVLIFFLQRGIFVTPEQLERKHREIIEDVESHFASVASVSDLKIQFCDMKEKIDKIYDMLLGAK